MSKNMTYGHIYLVGKVDIEMHKDTHADMISRNHYLGIDVIPGEKMAWIEWCCADAATKKDPRPEELSWTDYFYFPKELPKGWWSGHHNSNRNTSIFPDFIPARLLANKKEGDVLTLRFADTDLFLEVACIQKLYSYARYGTFEEAFKLLELD